MASHINDKELLTSVICKKADNLPVNEEEEQAYEDFEAVNPIDDYILRWEKFVEIDVSQQWAGELLLQFEERLKEAELEESVSLKTKRFVLRVKPVMQWAVAAILIVVSALLIFQYYKTNDAIKQVITKKEDVQPGDYRATLYLSNSKQISLKDLKNGSTFKDGSASIEKRDSGSLYYAKNNDKVASQVTNTLVTLRGETYSVQLSDGTKVYLNAQSNLKYPVGFTGATREVTLINGEAYFEVAQNGKPFIVNLNGNKIEVLGTKFNVNTYEQENKITATLLEGAIKVTADAKTVLLKPAQQAIIANGHIESKNVLRPENAISWVNGNFSFEKLTLKEVMYQIERWYNIEVVYEEEPELDLITIRRIPRNFELSKMLDLISEGGRFSYSISTDQQKVIIRK